jgi:hypothetical protein
MDDEWSGTNPDYVRHLMSHGRVVVAAAGETVLGFGAAQQIDRNGLRGDHHAL